MTTIVVKLGGCNGSGKTSVVRALMEAVKAKKGLLIRKSDHRNFTFYNGRHNDFEVFVLGNYGNTCGGMDTINNKEDVRFLFNAAVKHDGILIMEGLIVGKTYGYLGERLYGLGLKDRVKTLWAFMDTPFDVCAERVRARRLAKGNDKPFDPERTMRLTYTIMERLEAGVRSGKYPIVGKVMSLRHDRKPETLAKQLLAQAMEMYHETT